jgi:hypothetical protein
LPGFTMHSCHTLALLLSRLRRQPALYIFGAGASAPVVPLAPTLMLRTASGFIDLGSYAAYPAAETVLTARIKRVAEGFDFSAEWPQRPGTPELHTDELLQRLSHDGAFASFMYHLSVIRFTQRRIPNYTVLRAFHPSVMLSYNVDGLAVDTLGSRHVIKEMHGSITAGYGGPAGAEIMRLAQEYDIEMRHDDLLPCGPETFTDERLHRKLQMMVRSNPAFVMIVGYSFGKSETGYDDWVSLEALVGRFRGVPIDVYVLDPHPPDLAEMLSERLGSTRVHTFPVYWNVLAWAFTQILSGQLGAERLDYFHEQMLDDRGPGVVFPREE